MRESEVNSLTEDERRFFQVTLDAINDGNRRMLHIKKKFRNTHLNRKRINRLNALNSLFWGISKHLKEEYIMPMRIEIYE